MVRHISSRCTLTSAPVRPTDSFLNTNHAIINYKIAEWVTGDVKNGVKWGFDSTTDGTVVTHYVERTEQAKFHEIAEHAEREL